MKSIPPRGHAPAVYFRDLKKYADKRDSARKETLDDLFEEVTDAGKYDVSYQGDDS